MAGMPWVLPAALNDGDNQFALLIAESNLRPEQVGSAEVAAAEIGAVAAVAIDSVQGFAARDLRGVAWRPLLSGNESAGALGLKAGPAVSRNRAAAAQPQMNRIFHLSRICFLQQ